MFLLESELPKMRMFKVLFVITFVFGVPLFGQTAEPPATENRALSYGFVVDNSGSYRLLLERVITVVKNVASQNSASDEAFLITFVDTAKTAVRQEFTSEKNDLVEAADNMYVEGGITAVLDAVRLATDYLSANAKTGGSRSRALLLISDGDDRTSVAKAETVIASAKAANIRIFVIGLTDEKLNTKLLDRLAKETGGATFYPKMLKEISQVADNVSKAMRGN